MSKVKVIVHRRDEEAERRMREFFETTQYQDKDGNEVVWEPGDGDEEGDEDEE